MSEKMYPTVCADTQNEMHMVWHDNVSINRNILIERIHFQQRFFGHCSVCG